MQNAKETSYLNEAINLLNKGNFSDAETLLKTLLNTGNVKTSQIEKKIYYYLGETYYRSKSDLMRGIANFQKALEYDFLNSEKAEIYYKMGEIYLFMIDDEEEQLGSLSDKVTSLYQNAINNFEKCNDPQYEEYYINSSIYLAECYHMLNQYQKVINVLKSLNHEELNADDQREVQLYFGSAYFAMRDFQKALIHHKNVDTSIPDSITFRSLLLLGKGYFCIGKSLIGTKHLVQLIQIIYKNLEIGSHFLDTVFSIIKEIFEDEFNDEFIVREILEFVKKSPEKDVELFETLGDIYLEMLQDEKAQESYAIAQTLLMERRSRSNLI